MRIAAGLAAAGALALASAPVAAASIVGPGAAKAETPLVAPARRRIVVTSTDGVRLVVYEWGDPNGPPIRG